MIYRRQITYLTVLYFLSGLITEDGFVKCSTKEFNEFRQWVRKLKLDGIDQKRKELAKDEQDKSGFRKAVRDCGGYDPGFFAVIKERHERAQGFIEERNKKVAEHKKRLAIMEKICFLLINRGLDVNAHTPN